MNESELKNLLQEGDGSARVPTGGGALVEKVRGKAARRRQRRRAMRVGAVVVIVGGVTALLLLPGGGGKPVAVDVPRAVPTPHLTTTTSSMLTSAGERGGGDATQGVQAEIMYREKLVATLLEREAALGVRRRLEFKLAARGTVSPERAVGEMAAQVVVELADVIRANERRQAEARETYAGVVWNFPETEAARTARERLLEMGGL